MNGPGNGWPANYCMWFYLVSPARSTNNPLTSIANRYKGVFIGGGGESNSTW